MNGPEDALALATPSQVIAAPESDARGEVTETALKVFRHAGHGRINLAYRRPDGHIGWIDPPAMNVAGGH